MKLVISCYISSFLLCQAHYRPLYITVDSRGGKEDEDERKEAGVKVWIRKKRGQWHRQVSCLPGLWVMWSTLLQRIIANGPLRRNIGLLLVVLTCSILLMY